MVYLNYFWLCCVFIAAHGLALVAAREGFSLWWLLLVWSTGSRAWAQLLWRVGLVAPQHVECSWTRDRTLVPCLGRQILNHWTTREVPVWSYFFKDECGLSRRRQWHPTPVHLPGKSPWTEEPGRLQSMGLRRVGHN